MIRNLRNTLRLLRLLWILARHDALFVLDDVPAARPLLALSRLLVEALFVTVLGLLLFRGLLRPEVRAYLNEP